MQVSRAGCVLHLTEHHGDCCPGSTVFVWMTGLDEFHGEITAKGYGYLRPGVEEALMDHRSARKADRVDYVFVAPDPGRRVVRITLFLCLIGMCVGVTLSISDRQLWSLLLAGVGFETVVRRRRLTGVPHAHHLIGNAVRFELQRVMDLADF